MTTRKRVNQKALAAVEKVSGKPLTLGNLLWSIRCSDELTQVEFAPLLDVSKQYLCDVEKGRRLVSPKAAQGFALKLGYSPEQFIRLALQDMLDRDGVDAVVTIKVR